jgi:hypothetical protein
MLKSGTKKSILVFVRQFHPAYKNSALLFALCSMRSAIPLIIVINLLLFIPVILLDPSFHVDDFLVFAVIKANISHSISFNPHEYFYFFVRPVSYFFFWVDYKIWHTNAFMMKMVSLSFHVVFITIFYSLLKEIAAFIKINFKPIPAILIVLLFSFHPDSLIWIFWISNRTELLLILFYSLSILMLLKYLNYNETGILFLIGFSGFYILSMLSKQQSIHLPLLVLIFSYLFWKKYSKDKIKKLIITSLILLIPTLILITINYFTFGEKLFLLQNLWKKPFALIGIYLYSVFPFLADKVYDYFLFNRYVAVIILFALITVFYIINKKYRFNLKYIFYLLLLFVIVSFPRIMIEGGNRVNSIQIFWLLIIIYTVFSKINPKITYPLLLIYLICMTAFSLNSFKLWQYDISLPDNQTISFISLTEKSKENTIIVTGILSFIIPYQVYYFKYGDFGKENIEVLPVSLNYLAGPVKGDKQVRMIDCDYSKGDLSIRKIDNNAMLSIDPYNLKYSDIIKNRIKSFVRGYDFIKIKFENGYGSKNKNLVYYDGIAWNQIIK